METQSHPNSFASNFYIPQLVHYISGNNDTFLHHLLNSNSKTSVKDAIRNSNLSSLNITIK